MLLSSFGLNVHCRAARRPSAQSYHRNRGHKISSEACGQESCASTATHPFSITRIMRCHRRLIIDLSQAVVHCTARPCPPRQTHKPGAACFDKCCLVRTAGPYGIVGRIIDADTLPRCTIRMISGKMLGVINVDHERGEKPDHVRTCGNGQKRAQTVWPAAPVHSLTHGCCLRTLHDLNA